MKLAVLLEQLATIIDQRLLTEDEIKNYVDSLIDYLELNDYYKGTSIVHNNLDLSSYSFKTLKIKMFLERIYKIANFDYHTYGLKTSKPLFMNIAVLECIYHEVMHVFHNYVFTEKPFSSAPLFGNDILYINSLDLADSSYTRYYNCFLIERDANITSLENIMYILKVIVPNKGLYNNALMRLKGFINAGFDTRSPMEKVYQDLYNLDVPRIENLDLYDRLKWGLPISQKDFKYWEKNQNKIVLAKELARNNKI